MEILDIYAERGTKVVFLNQNGLEVERQEALKHLKTDEIYTVDYIDVRSWISYVRLKEVPNRDFNSVMFGMIEDKEPVCEVMETVTERDLLRMMQELYEEVAEIKGVVEQLDEKIAFLMTHTVQTD